METGASTDTRCVLCGRTDVATLSIPRKGSVCLSCIRNLNTTVEELVEARQKSGVGTNGELRVDFPATVSSDGIALPFAPLTLMQSAHALEYAETATLVPRRKRKSAPGFLLQVTAGGLAGLFLGLMILHFIFKIDLWKANFPKKQPSASKAEVLKEF